MADLQTSFLMIGVLTLGVTIVTMQFVCAANLRADARLATPAFVVALARCIGLVTPWGIRLAVRYSRVPTSATATRAPGCPQGVFLDRLPTADYLP